MSDYKPCGNYHLLPCGLDIECEVGIKYYDPDKSNQQVWEKYNDT